MRRWNWHGTNYLSYNSNFRIKCAAREKPMLPEFLLTETTVREAGTGPAMALGEQQGGTLVLTLGITRIIEQESIDLSIWGSADGTDWGTKPIATVSAEILLRNVPDYCWISRTIPT